MQPAPRPLPAVLLALLVLAPLAGAATVRTLTISTATVQPAHSFLAFDAQPLKLFDFDGDGDLEIVAHNDNRYLYVLDSRNGTVLAELPTTYPGGWGARPLNGVEAAVMVQGGVPHLLAQNSAAYVADFVFVRNASNATHFTFTKLWERRLSDCFTNPGSDSKLHLVDLDRDGKHEILAQTEESGVYALRSNGALYWHQCIGGGNAEPSSGDLDNDGWPEAVFVSDGGHVRALNGRTGAIRWTFWAGTAQWGLGSASMPVGATVAQIDNQPGLDVIVGARDNSDCEDFSQNHATLFALRGNGQLLWARQQNFSNPLTYTHPIVVDLDRNGDPEIYWGDWNTQGHKCGDWEQTGAANFYRYDGQGNLRWRQTLDSFWSNKDLALADVDGDGYQEILANGPNGGQDGIWYLDSRTGAKETFISTHPWKVTRAPIVADLYGNGTMQWVVPVYAYGTGSSGGAILVYDTGKRYRAAWPHLPDPPPLNATPPPPPPNGTFNATFRVNSPNAWWQEVYVSPSDGRPLSRVEVRINGGSWRTMTHSSWGAWTSSHHSPAGARVEFLATDPQNRASQSLPFTWMDGNLTKGSTAPGDPPPPPPPPFNPGFEVPTSVNENWVEVAVRTTDPLRGVEARVNSGPWQNLSATSWGTWARAMAAPRNSSVQFRATNAFDQVALSAPFAWMSGPSGFNATFTPQAVGNDWWVEVRITAQAPINSADARVNNGTWRPLALRDWGNWAASFNVPNGSNVQFRATNDLGNVALSQQVRWP